MKLKERLAAGLLGFLLATALLSLLQLSLTLPAGPPVQAAGEPRPARHGRAAG